MFPETSSTVRPALLKRGSPGPGAIEVIETSGNSGVIYYKPPARSTSPGASLPGQPVPERAHRNRCQLTPPRQFTKPQPNQRKPSQHQPATGSLISPLPLSGLLGPPPQKCLQAGLPRIGLQFLQEAPAAGRVTIRIARGNQLLEPGHGTGREPCGCPGGEPPLGQRLRRAEDPLDPARPRRLSSAAAASCPSPSAPGTCSPLNATGAAKPASRPMRRPTRSGTTGRGRMHDPCPCQRRSAN